MTMIIDSHMHIGNKEVLSDDIVDFLKNRGNWEQISYRLSPEGTLEALDEAGINKGVIFPLAFMPKDGVWQNLNDFTAKYVQKHSKRFIGLAIINPREIDETLHELERAFFDCALAGVKLHPTMQKVYINDAMLDPIYEFCQTAGKPMLIHTGASLPTYPDKYSMPLLLDEVAVKFPRLKIIAAHGGRPLYQDAALLIRKHENLYFDICANIGRIGGSKLLEMALTFIKIYADGLKKALFGSDHPVFTPLNTFDQLKEVKNSTWVLKDNRIAISDEEMELMLYRNAASLFNIKDMEDIL